MSSSTHSRRDDLPRKRRGRVVVTETVYHQEGDSNPTTTDSRFSVEIDSDEQPYVRRVRLISDWTPLEHGWLEGCSMLVVRNTSEEVIEVRAGSFVWSIPPRGSMRGCPASLDGIDLRCPSGIVHCVVTVFPK